MIPALRGDVVVLAGRTRPYTGKPRLALVVQADAFSGSDTIIVCLITSTVRDAPLLRVALPADDTTGLERPSSVQLEKITAIDRNQVGQRIGVAGAPTMLEITRKLVILLGIR